MIRVGLAYLVSAWLLLQIADVLFDPLDVPDWVMTALIVLVALGFPFSLIMAWAFQRTADGVKLDKGPVASGGSLAPAADISGDMALPDERSVAVVPFVDISPAHDNEYFTDGLTEELLNALRRIPDIKVASRTSCFAFKGRDLDASVVAEKLRVHHLVEGSVRKSGDKLRVAVQLIEPRSDTHLWSECYDESLDDIFTMQEDISRKICNAMKVTLHSQDAPRPTTSDPQAYDYFLRGLGFFTTRGTADLDFAIDMFTRATQIDPGFTKAWTQLAICLAMSCIYHGKVNARTLAEGAAQELLRIAPEQADTYIAHGMSLLAGNKYAEAMIEFEKAIAIDPGNFLACNNYARAAFHNGDLKTALKMFENAAHCDPEDWETVLLSIQIYEKFNDTRGMLEACREGVERVERFIQIYPDNQRAYYLGAFALETLGQSQRARAWIERALQIAPDDSATRYNAGCFYARVGDPDKAFENLRQSISSRSWVENDPTLDPLRQDPRFPEFLDSLK